MSNEIEGGEVGGAFDSNLFLADSVLVYTLNDNLRLVKEAVNNAIVSIYNNVDAMSAGWGGESYETYKTNMHSYEKYLYTYCFFIEAYRKLLTKLSSDIASTAKTIDSALDI